ncbi:nucleotidyl transferase AbiEii/AbiGii toxin family protein [Luteimonas sp. gir]|uniref:nucleotidyl transferase AbiEii/AbiGii toxin family protein n=1 Tax=Luteimonas sp. gir TaxID=3127960 RepID=UPI003075AF97
MSSVFERGHHRRIAAVLEALDGDRLRQAHCWFGGGTAIALAHGEYRESVDIDLMVSDVAGYRCLRQMLAGRTDLTPILKAGRTSPTVTRALRADQYGIRTWLEVDGVPIKFEIVLEGRIEFDTPRVRDTICGIATLTRSDLVASKLLANADRWADDSAFSRDALDLAMMAPAPRTLRPAIAKARSAYGDVVVRDLQRALEALHRRPQYLARCMRAMSMTLPPALLQQRLRALRLRLQRMEQA